MMKARIAKWIVRLLGDEQIRVIWSASALRVLDSNIESLQSHAGKRLLQINSLRDRIQRYDSALEAATADSLGIRMKALEEAQSKALSTIDQELVFIQRFKEQQEVYSRTIGKAEALYEANSSLRGTLMEYREHLTTVEATLALAKHDLNVVREEYAALRSASLEGKTIEAVVRSVMDKWLAERVIGNMVGR